MVAKNTAMGDFNLHNSFTFWITRLAGVMQDHFNQELKLQDVTWPQWMVMNVLEQKMGTTPAQVAANIGVDRSAITRLVDRLEKKNLVARVHDALDRRSIRLELTKSGQQLMNTLNAKAQTHQQMFLDSLPTTEYRGLKVNLQKMLKAGGLDTTAVWKHL